MPVLPAYENTFMNNKGVLSAYRFVQSEAQAAVFVEDEEAPLPFLQEQID